MSRSSSKFNVYTEDLASSIELMFVGAIRKGLSKGFSAAIEATEKDSGNAAVHWMIGVDGKSRPNSRKLGTPQDLRGTQHRSPHPWVYSRRFGLGRNHALSKALIDRVVARETEIILKKYAAGHTPSLRYSFFNAIGSVTEDNYHHYAKIAEAGAIGLEAAVKYFEAEVAVGNVRKYRRR